MIFLNGNIWTYIEYNVRKIVGMWRRIIIGRVGGGGVFYIS